MNNNLEDKPVQDEKASSKPNEPSLCQNCFEFFGNANTNNLCSTCFKDTQKPLNIPQIKPIMEAAATLETAIQQGNKIENDLVEEKKPEEAVKQIDNSKCSKCKKKVGLLGYECKCGSTYCKLHRLPEDHDCDFDFCSKEREKLKKANPLISATKLVKF